jgi:hypothetical protein
MDGEDMLEKRLEKRKAASHVLPVLDTDGFTVRKDALSVRKMLASDL